MFRHRGQHPSPIILAAMLALLALAGGCTTNSAGSAVPQPSRPDPRPGMATPAPPMMTPPDY